MTHTSSPSRRHRRWRRGGARDAHRAARSRRRPRRHHARRARRVLHLSPDGRRRAVRRGPRRAHYAWPRIADEFGARRRAGRRRRGRSEEQAVLTGAGRRSPTTSSCSRPAPARRPPIARAITFGEDVDERGAARAAARPRGRLRRARRLRRAERAAWPPAAVRARADDGARRRGAWAPIDVEFTVRDAGGRAARDLRRARRATPSPSCSRPPRSSSSAPRYTQVEHGHLIVDPGGRSIDVDRVVSLPAPRGPARSRASRPTRDGFIPVDEHGRVAGLDGVYAAGDGTAFPIKQGGLATQQADAVAETIAAAAGAPVEPQPFRPVLRGMLLTGGDAASCAPASRAARARPTSRPTRSGGRRPRSRAATSPRSCSAATSSRRSSASGRPPRGRGRFRLDGDAQDAPVVVS